MKLQRISGEVLLKNANIFDPVTGQYSRSEILIKNGRIAGKGTINSAGKAREIDCQGLIVTHGFCDIHVHFREPGREDKETLETGARAAIAGGFTHVCVMANTEPPVDTPESVRFIVEKSRNLPVKISPVGAISKGLKGKEITEMGSMINEGAVAFSDDGIPVQDGQVLRIALEYAGMFGVPVINHAEDIALRNDGLMNEGQVSTRLGLPGNPETAESTMVHRDLEIAKMTGSKIHIPHISSSESLEILEKYKKEYKSVTAEVTPHHLYFNDESLAEFNTDLKVAPPIRNEETRRNLVNGFKSGLIDCIATDHAPHTIEEKEGTFDLAPFGMIGLESCFGAVNKVLVRESDILLERLMTGLTLIPRKIMGLETDLLKEGMNAELVVFDPEEEWEFTEEAIHSRSKNSPFIGETLVGRVKYAIQGKWVSDMT